MTPREHYQRAEKLLDKVEEGIVENLMGQVEATVLVSIVQAHATLALVPLPAPVPRPERAKPVFHVKDKEVGE